MSIWIIDPHEPLIFREGKPFGPTPGARARSLPFPFPSTTTGGVRGQLGLNKEGIFDLTTGQQTHDERLKELRKLSVRGPLLVQLSQTSNDIETAKWLIPAPADALLLPPRVEEGTKTPKEELASTEEGSETSKKAAGAIVVKQLVPLKPEDDIYTDIQPAGQAEPLWLVGQPFEQRKGDPAKPYKEAPRYWYWEHFSTWLRTPGHQNWPQVGELGLNGPQSELRVHVAMDTDTRAGKEGMLFDTSGLEFTHITRDSKTQKRPMLPLAHAERLALAVMVEDKPNFTMSKSMGSFGGERRIVSWRKSTLEEGQLTSCPDDIAKGIASHKACRIFLLTPAYFAQGYLPSWICTSRNGVKPTLRAIAIQRPQVVSGWDMAKGKPKPSSRLAPAGTVLFLHLAGEPDKIQQWAKETWMQCISDDIISDQKKPEQEEKDQYRRDGFGLAVLGLWPEPTAVDMQKGAQA